jgi:alpha-tubulin suppressor-like RCC1 family protein
LNGRNFLTSNITQISVGLFHSLILTVDGNVFSCGSGANGRLGRTGDDFTQPITFSISVTSIAVGEHTSHLLAGGNLYSFGMGTSRKFFWKILNLSGFWKYK